MHPIPANIIRRKGSSLFSFLLPDNSCSQTDTLIFRSAECETGTPANCFVRVISKAIVRRNYRSSRYDSPWNRREEGKKRKEREGRKFDSLIIRYRKRNIQSLSLESTITTSKWNKGRDVTRPQVRSTSFCF